MADTNNLCLAQKTLELCGLRGSNPTTSDKELFFLLNLKAMNVPGSDYERLCALSHKSLGNLETRRDQTTAGWKRF